MTTYGPFITRAQAKEQGLTQYFTGKPCPKGHIDSRLVSSFGCMECARQKSLRQHEAQKNDPAFRARKAQNTARWRAANRERSLAAVRRCNRKRWLTDPDYRAQKLESAKTPARRAHLSNYERNRRISDPQFRFKQAMRSMLANRLKGANDGRGGRSEMLFGCSIERLRTHLGTQFTKGMSWENYGEWHVDHIRPCASFDLTDPEQQRQCFHYTNLQPLWAEDNIRKSDHWEPAVA